ncbi:MAG: hypothetical protein ACI379_05715 [Nocardioides sp.]|uniref:hypothetical protein n=1 Tax=Nocardioides sp. TaxID=35761 RepID=UPI003F09FD9B
METNQPRFRTRTWLMLCAVVPVGVLATVLAASIGRLDTALFFVGVPVLLALAIGLLPTENSAGTVFQVVTVVLLLVSAFLHEGALCVAIVSPLVYGLAFTVWGLVRAAQRMSSRFALGALVLLAVGEGALPGTRINPHQEVDAQRVVAAECSQFVDALDRGPSFDEADRGVVLRLAQYPVPTAADGSGLEVGDTWELTMPAGSIDTRVRARETAADAGRIEFEVTHDGARTTRWVSLTDATLTWQQTGEGCEAEVRLAFERDLDPAFYFAPVTDFFMSAGAATFLAGLD